MATLTDFRTRVAAKIGLDNSVSGDQTLIDAWLNEGVTDVVLKTRCKVTTGTLSLVAGTSDYTLSTSVLALIDIYVTASNLNTSFTRVTPQELLAMRRADTSTGTSYYYAVTGADLLLLYPTPDAAATVTYYYVPRPATLSSGTDTPSEIPAEYHKLVEHYALWQAADFDDDQTSAQGQRYKDLYEEGLKKARASIARKGGTRLPTFKIGRRPRVAYVPSQDVA